MQEHLGEGATGQDSRLQYVSGYIKTSYEGTVFLPQLLCNSTDVQADVCIMGCPCCVLCTIRGTTSIAHMQSMMDSSYLQCALLSSDMKCLDVEKEGSAKQAHKHIHSHSMLFCLSGGLDTGKHMLQCVGNLG